MATRGDIVGYKIPPWTRHQQLPLMRLVQNNSQRCLSSQFVATYPLLFHPCRSASSLSATHARLRSKGQDFEYVLGQFREFCQAIHNEVQNEELLDFPGDGSGIDEFTRERSEKVNERSVSPDATLESLRERTAGLVTPTDFGALVGPDNVRVLRKAQTVFRRTSPKCKPDIDLTDLGLQSVSRIHCKLSLAHDLNFYVTCLGKSILVNGCVFRTRAVIQIKDRDLIEVGGAAFIFFENQELMDQLRTAK
jgi:hypothetical protein